MGVADNGLKGYLRAIVNAEIHSGRWANGCAVEPPATFTRHGANDQISTYNTESW